MKLFDLPNEVMLMPRLHGFFFFQAEDGIRDTSVTGVQTCALPISCARRARVPDYHGTHAASRLGYRRERSRFAAQCAEIGRASCRERVEVTAVDQALKKKKQAID